MKDTVIKVENLGKLYHIGVQRERYKTLRDTLVDTVTAPIRRLRNPGAGQQTAGTLWALKNVYFQVRAGETVGIIGRNGAGKSTLLKVLSHITEPTVGRVTLCGRVGSLLEIGTGFHAELTGRENIYLNGAILGMKKAEIERKFDEIAAFAELEKFLDTPVKRYSSGMYMRLAFAVAAHLDPEILLVDEVLAVGDAEFQKKCLGKMSDVAGQGRTILFVSHNMNAIETLCNRTILLSGGQIEMEAETKDVVATYLSKYNQQSENPFQQCYRTGTGKIRVTSLHFESGDGQRLQVARSGEPLVFVMDFENHGCTHRDRASFSFSVHTDRDYDLFHYYSHFSKSVFDNLPCRGTVKCLLPELMLAPGNYQAKVRVVLNGDQFTGEEADWPRASVPFSVASGDFYRVGDVKLSTWAPILVRGSWSLNNLE